MNPIMHCDEASRLQSERLDRPLQLSERIALGFHLLLCSACRLFGRQIHAIDAAMASRSVDNDLDDLPPLPDATRHRLEQALQHALSGEHDT